MNSNLNNQVIDIYESLNCDYLNFFLYRHYDFSKYENENENLLYVGVVALFLKKEDVLDYPDELLAIVIEGFTINEVLPFDLYAIIKERKRLLKLGGLI